MDVDSDEEGPKESSHECSGSTSSSGDAGSGTGSSATIASSSSSSVSEVPRIGTEVSPIEVDTDDENAGPTVPGAQPIHDRAGSRRPPVTTTGALRSLAAVKKAEDEAAAAKKRVQEAGKVVARAREAAVAAAAKEAKAARALELARAQVQAGAVPAVAGGALGASASTSSKRRRKKKATADGTTPAGISISSGATLTSPSTAGNNLDGRVLPSGSTGAGVEGLMPGHERDSASSRANGSSQTAPDAGNCGVLASTSAVVQSTETSKGGGVVHVDEVVDGGAARSVVSRSRVIESDEIKTKPLLGWNGRVEEEMGPWEVSVPWEDGAR